MKNLKEEEQRVIGVTEESIMTIKGCEEAISLWEGRLNLLNNNVFSYRRNDSYKDVFGNLKSIELEINKHLKQLERFDKFINFESY